MSTWNRVCLSDVADVAWGDTNTTKKSYTHQGYVAFSATGPDGFLPYFDYEEPGVVVSAIGAQAGKTWYASGNWSCIKNTIRLIPREGKSDARFLYYLTSGGESFPVRGSAQPFIAQTDARSLMIQIPELNVQRRIAGVLGALDDLIDTNEGLIKTMQARLTAQFHKVSSPGAGTDVLANFVKSAARGVSPKYSESHDDFYVLNQKCIRDGLVRLQQARHMTARSVKAEKIAEPGDVVVNSTGVGTLGRAARWMGTEPIFVDSHVTVVKPSDPEEAAWIARSIIESIDEIEALAQGSTGQTELSKDQLLSLKIPVPRRNVRIQIAKEFDTIDSTIEALSAESIQLRRTRDELLPLLVSGKIRVREAEEVVASVPKGDG